MKVYFNLPPLPIDVVEKFAGEFMKSEYAELIKDDFIEFEINFNLEDPSKGDVMICPRGWAAYKDCVMYEAAARCQGCEIIYTDIII